MTNFRIRGPKKIIPVLLGTKQIADLDAYAEVSGMSRHELVRRAVALFFEELREDEEYASNVSSRHPDGWWPDDRDQDCRSAALPPAYRFPLPPSCGEPGE
jgi:hypothetical protein